MKVRQLYAFKLGSYGQFPGGAVSQTDSRQPGGQTQTSGKEIFYISVIY